MSLNIGSSSNVNMYQIPACLHHQEIDFPSLFLMCPAPILQHQLATGMNLFHLHIMDLVFYSKMFACTISHATPNLDELL
jgi:hypothetical protein